MITAPALFVIAIAVCIWAGQQSGRRIGGYVVILYLVMALCITRFGIHYFILSAGEHVSNELYLMGLAYQRVYDAGLLLASWFLIFFSVGHYFGGMTKLRSAAEARALKRNLILVVFASGLLSIFLFIALNGSGLSAIASGEFRRTEIRAGTGNFFYFGLISIPSGILLLESYLSKGRVSAAAAVAICFFLAFAALGGRVRALVVPVAFFLVLVRYRRECRRSPGSLIIPALLLCALLPAFLILGLYRSGYGLSGELLDTFNFADLFVQSYMSEIGQLHSLIASSEFSGALLRNGAWTNLFWPLNEAFGEGGRSGGVFVVESLLDDFSSGRKWGFHATMIGDAYLGLGIAGVWFFSFLAGWMLAFLGKSAKHSRVRMAFYALAVIELLRIIFETMDKIPEVYITLTMYWVLVKVVKGERATQWRPSPAYEGHDSSDRSP